MDKELGYTRKDAKSKDLVGEKKWRKQLSQPSSDLGYCSPLALLTNGEELDVTLL